MQRRSFIETSVVAAAALGPLSQPAAAAQPSQAVTSEKLWPDGPPGAKGSEPADIPTIDFYPADPAKAGTTAVVVCPGGAYGHLAADHEGKKVAEWFNSIGVWAFVLKYRIAPRYMHPAPSQDARRAIRYVRHRAAQSKFQADRIGICGFSAGGHLASTVSTHIEKGNPAASDPLERLSARPDFAILGYPVISLTTEWTHRNSRKNLLGDPYDQKLALSLSTDTQVTAATPPTFLFHTDEDTGVPPENSILFYMALRKAKVPAEMHIYERGKHGVGLAPQDPILSTWSGRLADWLKTRGLLQA